MLPTSPVGPLGPGGPTGPASPVAPGSPCTRSHETTHHSEFSNLQMLPSDQGNLEFQAGRWYPEKKNLLFESYVEIRCLQQVLGYQAVRDCRGFLGGPVDKIHDMLVCNEPGS